MGVDVTCTPREVLLTRRRYFKEPSRPVADVRAEEAAVGFGSQPGDTLLAAKQDERWHAPTLAKSQQGGLSMTAERQTGLDLDAIHGMEDLRTAVGRVVADPEQDPIASAEGLLRLLRDSGHMKTRDPIVLRRDTDPRDVQRVVIASGKEIGALARKAAAPGAGGDDLIAFVRGLAKHDAVMLWAMGRDRLASTRLRDAFIPVEGRTGKGKVRHLNKALKQAGVSGASRRRPRPWRGTASSTDRSSTLHARHAPR